MARYDKEEVRGSTDIIQLISSYGIELKRAGRLWKARCPFHEEKTPSFHVYPDPPQRYRCFGACDEGGDVFAFVMQRDGLDFPEALERLAQAAGVRPLRDSSPREKQNNLVYDALERACKFFESRFPNSPAYHYLKKRKIDDKTMEQFRVGQAPGSPQNKRWGDLLNHLSKDFDPKVLEEAGLVGKSEFNRYYSRKEFVEGRVVFPIFSPTGKVQGFAARVLDDSLPKSDHPKYRNSPASKVYNKSKILYGLNFSLRGVRDAERVVIVEGYTDVMQMHQENMNYSIATGGTAFTPEHVKLVVSRFPHFEVIFGFDRDKAGIKAATKAVEVSLGQINNSKVCLFPKGEDPASLLEDGRKKDLEFALDKANSGFDFYVEQKSQGIDLDIVEGKITLIESIRGPMTNVPKEMRRVFLEVLSDKIGLSVDAISCQLYDKGRISAGVAGRHTWETRLLQRILAKPTPGVIKYVSKRMKPEHFLDTRAREVFIYFGKSDQNSYPLFGGVNLFSDKATITKALDLNPETAEYYVNFLFDNIPEKVTQEDLDEAMIRIRLGISSFARSAMISFRSGKKSIDDILYISDKAEDEFKK